LGWHGSTGVDPWNAIRAVGRIVPASQIRWHEPMPYSPVSAPLFEMHRVDGLPVLLVRGTRANRLHWATAVARAAAVSAIDVRVPDREHHIAMVNKQHEPDQWSATRRRMIDEQIRRRGPCDPRVIEAMMSVPRERFVPANVKDAAYQDRALPIGHGQTISQPFIVAYMTDKLSVTHDDRVLEIGTGTGYQTAILATLAKHVFTVERIAALHERAATNLTKLNLANITMSVGDGTLGLAEYAPYDRILTTAAAPSVPGPLADQLVDGGVLVIPVGGPAEQTIVRVIRKGRRTVETPMLACRFVKLIGREGWPGGKT